MVNITAVITINNKYKRFCLQIQNKHTNKYLPFLVLNTLAVRETHKLNNVAGKSYLKSTYFDSEVIMNSFEPKVSGRHKNS